MDVSPLITHLPVRSPPDSALRVRSRYPRGVLEMLSLKAASVLAKEPLEKQGRRKITSKKPRGCLESCQQRPFGPWWVGAGNYSGAGQCVGTALNTAATFCGFSSTKKE